MILYMLKAVLSHHLLIFTIFLSIIYCHFNDTFIIINDVIYDIYRGEGVYPRLFTQTCHKILSLSSLIFISSAMIILLCSYLGFMLSKLVLRNLETYDNIVQKL